jgi:hypothetical protein
MLLGGGGVYSAVKGLIVVVAIKSRRLFCLLPSPKSFYGFETRFQTRAGHSQTRAECVRASVFFYYYYSSSLHNAQRH